MILNNAYNILRKIEKGAKTKLLSKYGPHQKNNNSSLKYKYIGMIMENLIFNKNTHEVTIFKDYMIWDYIEEFFKRIYLKKESFNRIPKFSSFYKNYLKFFCIPTFIDVFPNELLHGCSEKKAELFYNENYKRKQKKTDEDDLKDCGLYEDSESNLSESKNINITKKIFFDETARKKIEKYSPINTSMVLNESETKLKEDDSGLLVTISEIDLCNENSLRDIVKGLKKKTKNKNIINKNNNIELKNNLFNFNMNKTNFNNEINTKEKNKNSRNKSLDIFLNITNNKKNIKTNSNINNNNKINDIKLYLKEKNNKKKTKTTYNITNNNNSKMITSINNYNYSRNNQFSNTNKNRNSLSVLNSNNTYNNNNKINNIKKTINLNLIRNKNLETILGLGKYTIQQQIQQPSSSSISLIKTKRQNSINNNKNEKGANSLKNIFIKNTGNSNTNNIKVTSYKYFMKNSVSSLVKLPKANVKKNYSQENESKMPKKTARILSYKDINITENKNEKKINTKISFDGIMNKPDNKKYNIINYNNNGHIHNVNININNHINIGTKQFQEIFSISDLIKKNEKNNLQNFLKNNVKKNNYISRNKNNSLGFNSIMNHPNKNNKMNSATDIHNTLQNNNKNSIYKTQYMVNKGYSGNLYEFKNKKSNKIRLNNQYLFSSLKNKFH